MIDTLQQPIIPPQIRVSLDLETIEGTPDELKKEFDLEFKKAQESLNIMKIDAEQAQEELDAYQKNTAKPLKKDMAKWEKIIDKAESAQEALNERQAEWMNKAACKNSAQIICASFIADREAYAFTLLPLSDSDKLTLFNSGIQVSTSSDETTMLTALNRWLDSLPIAIIGAHNGYHFDYPKVMGRCARLDVPKAAAFQPTSDVRRVDTMYEYCRHYLMGEERYCSLEKMCLNLGLNGKPGKGSEVTELYDKKQYVTILQYCTVDALLVDQAMDKMEIYAQSSF